MAASFVANDRAAAVRFLPFLPPPSPPPLIYLVGKAALNDGGGEDDDDDIRHGANQACKTRPPLRLRMADTKSGFVFRAG